MAERQGNDSIAAAQRGYQSAGDVRAHQSFSVLFQAFVGQYRDRRSRPPPCDLPSFGRRTWLEIHMKIAIVTGSRADWSALEAVYNRLSIEHHEIDILHE